MSPAQRLVRWTDARRKMAASAIALFFVMAYAIWTKAPFAEVANAIEWILGIFVTGHAATDVLNMRKGIPPVDEEEMPPARPRPPPLPGKKP